MLRNTDLALIRLALDGNASDHTRIARVLLAEMEQLQGVDAPGACVHAVELALQRHRAEAAERLAVQLAEFVVENGDADVFNLCVDGDWCAQIEAMRGRLKP